MIFKSGVHFEQLSSCGDPFVFVHANAYTPGCYKSLLDSFLNDYALSSLKLRALWPNTDYRQLSSWHDLVADYNGFLNQRSITNAIGMGHSVGAIMTILAELLYPGRFKKIILLDPVLFPFSGQLGLLFFKLIIGQLPFVKKTYQRQLYFDSYDDVFHHYRTKKIFKFIDDDVLRDICRSLFVETNSGVRLIQSPEWEAQLYKVGGICFPYFWKAVKNIDCPVLLLAGTESNICKPKQINKLDSLCKNITIQYIEQASHLLPFEHPKIISNYIHQFLN